MFCSNCGKQGNPNLKFCSGCGERLANAAELDVEGMPGKMLDNILTAVFLIVLFGLGILVGLVAVLLGSGVAPNFVVMISLGYLAAVFGICYTLLTQVPKLVDARLRLSSAAIEPAPLNLAPATTAQLGTPAEVPASVTENTTRTLDEVPLRRSAQ